MRQINNPILELQRKISEFVAMLTDIRDYGKAERITPWVRAACQEFPGLRNWVMQDPQSLLRQLSIFSPALAAKIPDRAAAIKTLNEIQARLKAPDPGL